MCKDMYAWKDASCYHVASKHSISPRLQDLHLGPGRKVGFTSREEAMRAAEDALLGPLAGAGNAPGWEVPIHQDGRSMSIRCHPVHRPTDPNVPTTRR